MHRFAFFFSVLSSQRASSRCADETAAAIDGFRLTQRNITISYGMMAWRGFPPMVSCDVGPLSVGPLTMAARIVTVSHAHTEAARASPI